MIIFFGVQKLAHYFIRLPVLSNCLNLLTYEADDLSAIPRRTIPNMDSF